MPDFGIFRGFNDKLFGNKLYAGQLPTQLGLIGSESFGLLLDAYTGAAAAYSLRLLRAAYTGYAIKVRRASDNTEQDIGFSNNELDTTSLASFCSGTDGFVTTWYDQSGNGYNATQTTAANQPQIVSSGSVITENGKAAVDFNGANNFLEDTVSIVSDYPFSLIDVATPDTLHIGAVSAIVNNISTTEMFANVYNSSDNNEDQIWTRNGTLYREGPVMVAGQQDLNFLYWSSDTVSAIHVNGSSAYSPGGTTDFPSVNSLGIGSLQDQTPGQYFNGKIQEVIWYAYDQSSNRTGIETNINNFYSIY